MWHWYINKKLLFPGLLRSWNFILVTKVNESIFIKKIKHNIIHCDYDIMKIFCDYDIMYNEDFFSSEEEMSSSQNI